MARGGGVAKFINRCGATILIPGCQLIIACRWPLRGAGLVEASQVDLFVEGSRAFFND